MKRAAIASMTLSLILISSSAVSQYASWTKSELLLDNGIVKRMIKLPTGNENYLTTLYKPVDGNFFYFLDTNPDFRFEINDTPYSGNGNWSLTGIKTITDQNEGNGASVTILSNDK